MSPEDRRLSNADSARLQGFLQLLMAPNGELPKATPEILEFLEHAAKGIDVPSSKIARFAEHARRQVLEDRLRAADTTGVRPLGLHLRFKRAEAGLESAPVASALELENSMYEQIEDGRRSPLNLHARVLVRIVELFGVSIAELRDSVLQSLQEPWESTGPGIARSADGEFVADYLVIAKRDLLNAGDGDERPVKARDLELLEEKLTEVRELLAVKRRE